MTKQIQIVRLGEQAAPSYSSLKYNLRWTKSKFRKYIQIVTIILKYPSRSNHVVYARYRSGNPCGTFWLFRLSVGITLSHRPNSQKYQLATELATITARYHLCTIRHCSVVKHIVDIFYLSC